MTTSETGVATSGLSRQTATAVILLACRLVVGLVFLYASVNKILDPAGFAKAVYNYRLVPLPLLHVFAVLLPWVEGVAGLALLLGVFRRGAALLCLLMTLMFTVAVSAALARSLDISCGCFHTEGGASVGLSLLVRDIALLVACCILVLIRRAGELERSLWRRNG